MSPWRSKYMWLRVLLVTALCVGVCLATWYCHSVLGMGVVVTHFFYLPIILAAIWWKYRGVVVAVALSAVLVVSHRTYLVNEPMSAETVRISMFIVVALTVALLRRRIERLTTQRERQRQYHQAELMHASRLTAMGEMAAGMAHELNQPLSAILSYGRVTCSMLEREPAEVVQARETLAKIMVQSERAAEIIKRVRVLTKKHQPIYEPFDVVMMVHEALDFMTCNRMPGHAMVRVNVGGEAWELSADRLLVQQVLINLIQNACDAMRDVPVDRAIIGVSVMFEPERVTLAVSDCGCGIDEKTRSQMFDAFFTTKSQGLGMGLAVCRSIVEAHRGRIDAVRNAAGGCTVSVVFPKAKEMST